MYSKLSNSLRYGVIILAVALPKPIALHPAHIRPTAIVGNKKLTAWLYIKEGCVDGK